MELIVRTTRVDCMAASIAMCTNSEIHQFFSFVGHDGGEVLWPELRKPLCFRGFHVQELCEYALYKGFAATMIEKVPMYLAPNGVDTWPIPRDHEKRFLDALYNTNRGVLLCTSGEHQSPHAVAFNNFIIYDPIGRKYPYVEREEHGIRSVEALLRVDRLPT